METKDGLLLLCSAEEASPWYETFLYGVEEEGVPLCCIKPCDELLSDNEATALAKLSARYCCFDLGIGVDEKELVVFHRLQEGDSPLIRVFRNEEKQELIRRAGHNTARIIKSIPLILEPPDI